jgi:hypothetical protein
MTPQEHRQRIWRWSPVGWLPIASYAMLVGYACFAMSVVGHWPYYAHPDPKDLPGGSLVKVVTFTTLAGLASVVLIPAAFGFSRLVAAWQKKESLTLQQSAARMYLFGAIVWCIDLGLKSAGRHSLTSWILD